MLEEEYFYLWNLLQIYLPILLIHKGNVITFILTNTFCGRSVVALYDVLCSTKAKGILGEGFWSSSSTLDESGISDYGLKLLTYWFYSLQGVNIIIGKDS